MMFIIFFRNNFFIIYICEQRLESQLQNLSQKPRNLQGHFPFEQLSVSPLCTLFEK